MKEWDAHIPVVVSIRLDSYSYVLEGRNSYSYFALSVQELHALSSLGMTDGVILALLIVTHIVEGCCWRRRRGWYGLWWVARHSCYHMSRRPESLWICLRCRECFDFCRSVNYRCRMQTTSTNIDLHKSRDDLYGRTMVYHLHGS